jgi:hypothetical protein
MGIHEVATKPAHIPPAAPLRPRRSSGSIAFSSVISRTPAGPRGPRLRPGYHGQAEALKRLPARSPPKARGAVPQSTQLSV